MCSSHPYSHTDIMEEEPKEDPEEDPREEEGEEEDSGRKNPKL